MFSSLAKFKQNIQLSNLQAKSWTILVIAIALAIASPIILILGSVFFDASEVWKHLAATVLPDYIFNSLCLMLGVGCGVLVIGVGTAWLVTTCSFWGSRLWEWMLVLPLAAPAYLLAYTYTNMLDFYGPVQTWLRHLFGWSSATDYWFPNIRSLVGAIAMLTLVLYPYVYLLARVAFLEQSGRSLEASRCLGCGPWRSFFTIALPLARPSILAGLALALMETLNDVGTVEYFGVTTFTLGIYRTWRFMDRPVAAAQLAAVMLLFVVCLIWLERLSRRQAKYYQTGNANQPISRYQLGWLRGTLAWIGCFVPATLGFLLPAGFLLHMTLANADRTLKGDFISLALNSLFLATITATLAVVISLIMAYGQRLYPNLGIRLAVNTASMGYAVPGSVIAMAILIAVARFNIPIAALIFAFLVRFLAVSFGAVESSLNKIKPSLDDAARSLGYDPTSTMVKVHAPLMWGGMLTAGMLVFVDVMKELPASFAIRPLNFNTLAVRVYQYASDERLIEAAAPALTIVLVGIIPVILLSWRIAQSRPSSN